VDAVIIIYSIVVVYYISTATIRVNINGPQKKNEHECKSEMENSLQLFCPPTFHSSFSCRHHFFHEIFHRSSLILASYSIISKSLEYVIFTHLNVFSNSSYLSRFCLIHSLFILIYSSPIPLFRHKILQPICTLGYTLRIIHCIRQHAVGDQQSHRPMKCTPLPHVRSLRP